MKTALYSRHVALGAKMVDFSGWEMPLQYSGILEEALHVRKAAGVFDVSHMGRIVITGKESEPFLDYLSTNQIAGKKEHSATYTVWCNSNGGAVDDGIVYKEDAEHFFVIVNAANRLKDHAHFLEQSKKFAVKIEDRFQEEGILAIQGPQALSLLQQIVPAARDVKPMHFIIQNQLILSGTGYTGAGGCEVFAPNQRIVALWDALLEAGALPVGLGARNVLRLEKGYALYGHEISDTIAPTESIAAWTVKVEKGDFLGKAALLKLKNPRHAFGIVMAEKGIARDGYEVYDQNQKIGFVTSGTFSPHLERGIALILTEKPLKAGDEVSVMIRNKQAAAKVVSLPFL